MINFDEIRPDDLVTVQDAAKNVLVGPVAFGKGGHLLVEAFGTYIEVARTNRMGHLTPLHGLKIVGHQPDLLSQL